VSAVLRLLVCDDSAPAREAVRALLVEHDGLEIVGEAENGEEAVALAIELAPDVILMDVSMPLLDGVAATRRIREQLPATRIVALAGSAETETVMAMMAAGASAYCVKGAPLWELERAIGSGKDPLLRLAHALARSAASGRGELVARELAQITGADIAAVYVAEPRLELELSASAGPGAAAPPAAICDVARRAIRDSTLVRSDDGSGALAVPLVADGVTLGAVVVAMPDGADAELVSSVADLASAAFAAERRLEASRAEARRDALTGLANRRAFEERLEEAVREAPDASVVLLDLDDFKTINDTRGHAAGDDVLRRVGLVLSRVVRADEGVYRIGGEEFALIVDAGAEEARAVAERIRAALAVQDRGGPLPTVSAGVATLDADAAEVLRRADAALYAAKWTGKDRVLVYCTEVEAAAPPDRRRVERSRPRVLLVDDDDRFRTLLRTTLEPADLDVVEAGDAAKAARLIEAQRPDVVVLDVHLPGLDGLTFCRRLKAQPATQGVAIVLLTGDDGRDTALAADAAGADAFLRKPFSPLELLDVVERLAGRERSAPVGGTAGVAGGQVELFAHDLRRVLEIERGQRLLLQKAYREAVTALATALESKDTGTREHSQRVQRYALELAAGVDQRLLDDPSLEYGFLLHDVGKIGIPDRILLKPAPLADGERRLMETHPVLGEQMLSDVALLKGQGLKVVRSHHERWDGTGYPDGLAGRDIPLGARIFAVADTLDAMTSDRPYRRGMRWDAAVAEIERGAGRQFDPQVVHAFVRREHELRQIRGQLMAV
jgi:diguanylate cyclase (GGDEF)-like protein